MTSVAVIAALFMFIAFYEGDSMWVSTLIGVIFIGCFIWYLLIVAPTPYTIRCRTLPLVLGWKLTLPL